MKRKVVGALGALSLGVASLIWAGATAQAQESEAAAGNDTRVQGGASCKSMSICLYEHDDYKGDRLVIPDYKNAPSLSALGFDNKASSIANLTKYGAHLYTKANYAGATYYSSPKNNGLDSDLTNNNFDNKASSLRYKD
jgi:hypothetical protein